MLKLIEQPLSPYAQKVKICLREKGVAFEAVTPEGFSTGEEAGELFAANPRLEVPALVADGRAIFDSRIIVQFIDEAFEGPALMPTDPFERARVRMIEEVVDTQYDAVNWGCFELLGFRRAEGALRDSMMARAREQTAGLQAFLARELGERLWFGGASIGIADAAVYPYLSVSATLGMGPAEGSALAAWLTRMAARPSAAKTGAEAAASLGASGANLPKAIREGRARRQYRDHRVEWMIRSGGIDIVLAGMKDGTIRFSREID